MSINPELLAGFKDMIQDFEDASSLDTFVGQLDDAYREALSDEIADRRSELADMPAVSEATTAEMADYFENNPEEFDMLADAIQDEEEDGAGEGEAEGAEESVVADEKAGDVSEEADEAEQEDGNSGPDSTMKDYDEAQYSQGDKVKWSWQGSTVHGKVANVGDSFTVEGNEISGEEGEAVYKLDEWDDDAEEFNNGNVAKPESSLSSSDKNMEASDSEQEEEELTSYAETELTDSDTFEPERAKINVLGEAGIEDAKQFFLVTDNSPAGLQIPVAQIEDGEVVVSARALETASTRLGALDLSDEEEQEALDRLQAIRSEYDVEPAQSDDSEKRVKKTLTQALAQMDVDLPVEDASEADLEMLAAAVRDQSESLSETAADASAESMEDDDPSPAEMLDRLMEL